MLQPISYALPSGSSDSAFTQRGAKPRLLCPKFQSILLKSIIRFQASVVFINLIKSLVKRLETSQFTKGRNRFILYIREDSNSSLMGSETHRKIQIYEKRVFKNLANQLKIYKLSRRETLYFLFL